MRLAMINTRQRIVDAAPDKIKLIMQGHDEMVFECDAAGADEFAARIRAAARRRAVPDSSACRRPRARDPV